MEKERERKKVRLLSMLTPDLAISAALADKLSTRFLTQWFIL